MNAPSSSRTPPISISVSSIWPGGSTSTPGGARPADGPGPRYISFVQGRSGGHRISKYFREFLGCEDYTSSKEQTEKLIKVVKRYFRLGMHADPPSPLDPTEIDERAKDVADYCIERIRQRQTFYLEDLSRYLDEHDPERFLSYANGADSELSNSFDLHRETLRRLWRLSGRSRKLSLSFDRSLLNRDVIYDAKKETLEIRKLPADLKRELDAG